MKEIGIALIGAGKMAQNFHLPILSRHPNVKILAICDRSRAMAAMVAEKFGVPYVCEDVEELLSLDAIEAVDICTTTDSHCFIAIESLKRGKNVLIEKPIARSLEEARKIQEAVQKYDGKLMVGMAQRFRYDTIMLKNYVKMGEIGEVFYAKAGWLQQKRDKQWHDQIEKAGGGVLLDLGISLIDSLMWIYDFLPVRSVKANMYQHLTKNVEDVCIASIHFENGSMATFEVSWTLFSSKNDFYCDVHGSKGSASVNPLQLYKQSGDVFRQDAEDRKLSRIAIFRKSFESEINHFVNALSGLGPVHSTAGEAVQIMRILEAMYESAKEKKEIYL